MTSVDAHERVEAEAIAAANDKAKALSERDIRRADAVEAVLRARSHSPRKSEPVTALQAATMWSMAELLHNVASEQAMATVTAQPAAPSVMRLNEKIEAGIAEMASAPITSLQPQD